VPQPAHPASRGPRRRSDSTAPPARQAVVRRPYPTASTTTKVSLPRPGSARAGSRSNANDGAPTPSTVWTAGPEAADLGSAWPPAIVAKAVDSFSKPAESVVLMSWPGSNTATELVGPDGVLAHAPGDESDAELADALVLVEHHGRRCRIVHACAAAHAARARRRAGIRPAESTSVNNAELFTATGSVTASGTEVNTSAKCDLVITSLLSNGSDVGDSDAMAVQAARLLRVGGILVVLTRSDWTRGELTDPSGGIVAAAQNADLLYLQHVVALHRPIRDGEFVVDPGEPARGEHALADHRAAVRGLPTPHLRIHTDLLVFAQPHTPEPASVASAVATGVVR